MVSLNAHAYNAVISPARLNVFLKLLLVSLSVNTGSAAHLAFPQLIYSKSDAMYICSDNAKFRAWC